MRELEQVLESGQTAVVCSVTGGPGVGKTHLAASLARKCIKAEWDLVAWIVAESPSQVVTGLGELADAVGAGADETNTQKRARAAKRWLENTTGRVLVVFDNVTTPDVVAPWLPATGHARVVVTSRSQRCDVLGAVVGVDLFTEAETVAYLRERTGLDDDAGARAVGEAVGRLPLALAQAAAVIRSQRLSYAAYIDRLERFPLENYLTRVDGDGYPRGASEAIALAVEEVETTQGLDGLTRRLLEVLSVLSPAGVNREFLAHLPAHTDTSDEVESNSDNDDDRAVVGAERVEQALGVLADASLVSFTQNNQSVLMHRLVARVLRERARRFSRFTDVLTDAVDILDHLQVPSDKAWEQRQIAAEVVDHIDALTAALERDPDTGRFIGALEIIERVTDLRIWAAEHLTAVENLTRAIDFGRALLIDTERTFGPDHLLTLTTRHNLAGAYESAGQLEKAIDLFQQVLTTAERTLGPNHPSTLTTRANLAGAYRQAGQLEKAIDLFQQVLTTAERTLGPNHPSTLTTRHNLAGAYESAGQLEKAITLYHQVLTTAERTLGPNHPDTSATRRALDALTQATAGRARRRFGFRYRIRSRS